MFLLNTRGKALQKQPYRRCSKVSFSVLSQIYAKMWKAIFTKFSLILKTKRPFHNLIPPHQISFVPQSSDLLGHPHTALVHLEPETS